MKKASLVLVACLAFTILTACSSGASSTVSASGSSEPEIQASEASSSSSPTEPLNLDGEWKQVNKSLPLGPHQAIIEGNTITIYWVDEAAESKSLYWVGSYNAQTEPNDTWEWVSERNHEQTDTSLYAAQSDTKTFKYEDGQIVYDASMLGTTQTVRLERA